MFEEFRNGLSHGGEILNQKLRAGFAHVIMTDPTLVGSFRFTAGLTECGRISHIILITRLGNNGSK